MSKLKVAICLSGLVGSTSKGGKGETVDFKLAKKYFDKNLINENIDVSFFLHCWKNNFHEEILNLYNPKKYCFEDPLSNKDSLNFKEYGIISNNYSKLRVNELKRKFENENHIIFDYVILTRFDILILEKLDYEILSRNKFYVVGPKIHHNKNCKCSFCNEKDPNHSLNDLFFLSSSKSMDIFSETYLYLKEYGLKSNHIITKQHLLKTNLYKNISFIFKLKANLYPSIWFHLERIGIFPRNLVAVRIYDTNVPLIRWVYKSTFLKFLDFIIFKGKIDLIYEYFIKIFKKRTYIIVLKNIFKLIKKNT